MFYSHDEYNGQVDELMSNERYSFAEACAIVQYRMEQDQQEYNDWLDGKAVETQV
jgi:hypothetical protein